MGLFLGIVAPNAVPPGILGTVGLIIFFYGIGIQYGKPFVEGLLTLAYASKLVPNHKPEFGYALVFPSITMLKIIVVQLIWEALN